jgi:predicted RecB family nuclease
MAAKITREVLEGYLECLYKGRLRLAGEAGESSDYGSMTAEQRQDARDRGLEHLLSRSPGGLAFGGGVLTTTTLSGGPPVVTDFTLADEQFGLRCDGLVRAAGMSCLGDFHYLPVLCCEGPAVRSEQKHLLAVVGLIVGALQGRQPAGGMVVHGTTGTRAKVKLTAKLIRRAADTVAALKQLQAGGAAPVLTLNGHCRVCEFQQRCLTEAVRQDDISLLRGMGEAEVRQHRSKGIFTVTQLSYTFRPRRRGKRVKGREEPHHSALQALAIREGKTFVLARPEVPDRPTRIYLDLEGDADAASVYLLGALVVRGAEVGMHSFWSDDPTGESHLLDQLLQLAGGEDYALFHFGSYERGFLKRMRRTARRKGPIDRLLTNATDVLSLIRSAIYFPVYANGLKEIGRHLGLTWTDPTASGAQALAWRHEWERTCDEAIKRRLIAYNADDCAALRAVTEHIAAIGANFDREGAGVVERVTASTCGTDFRKWGDRATYAGLLKKIVAGNLVRADETGVRFKDGRGYVWVFTDLENVAFMVRPTR